MHPQCTYATGRQVCRRASKCVFTEQGYSPSQREARLLQRKTEDKVTLELFLSFLQHFDHSSDTAESLASFFESFDVANKGTLTRKQMRNILTTFGERLTEAEADLALKTAVGEGGEEDLVDYTRFCAKCVQPFALYALRIHSRGATAGKRFCVRPQAPRDKPREARPCAQLKRPLPPPTAIGVCTALFLSAL